MKTFLHVSGSIALSLSLACLCAAQAPQPQQGPAAGAPHTGEQHHFPPPKNLQVLPKTLTAEQVHDIMHKWEGALGTNCAHCHAVDPKHVGPNGRPMLNFADDSKPEKRTARLMLKMTEKINTDYISMVEEESGQADGNVRVTCGTCHRGHVKPEAFIPPPEHHEGGEHHEMPPMQQQPQPK